MAALGYRAECPVGKFDLESIKQALIKANLTRGNEKSLGLSQASAPSTNDQEWTPRQIQLDPTHLERHRIVSFAMKDRHHVAFNLLRTKVYRVLKEKGWTSIGVTSPTSGCGKTTVAVNLALSLARLPECKTVLLDLDLVSPAVGRMLGISEGICLKQYLEGAAELEQCFLQITNNLVVGMSGHPLNSGYELPDEKGKEILHAVKTFLQPKVVLVDLPPLLSTDRALAFLPYVDCSLLVIASGTTTAREIDECKRQLGNTETYLGVVLNKTPGTPDDKYSYGIQ
jgi:protein-tyrosine kinase